MTAALPPTAATGRPPPMTLPKVNRSGVQPGSTVPASRPHQPAGPTRKPVSTSSSTSSAPCSAVIRRSAALNPGAEGTTPMLAGCASVMTTAIRSPWRAKASSTAATSLYGRTRVSAAVAAVTPAEPGSPSVARPEPAAARSPSEWPW